MQGVSRRSVLLGAAGTGAGVLLGAPAQAAAVNRGLRRGSGGPAVTTLQRRLSGLGYWCGAIDGVFGSDTHQAVVAVQKVCGLERDGVVGPRTTDVLARGLRPGSRRGGDRLEVDTKRQVVLVVRAGAVHRVLSTSTGNGQPFTYRGRRTTAVTPPGEYRITWHGGNGWDHGELGALWRPHYFTGGIAFHGAQDVPAHPASHGCCRLTVTAQDALIAAKIMRVGVAVSVY